MKKLVLSLMAVAALIGVALAMASTTSPAYGIEEESPGIWRQGNVEPAVLPRTTPLLGAAAEAGGFYLDTDTLQNGAWRTRSMEMEVVDKNTGKVVIKQIYGYDTECAATVDGNVISIPVQSLYRVMVNDTASAPVSICPVDLTAQTFDPSHPLTGTIASDGTMTLPSWGLVVLEHGPYYGYVAVAMRSSLYRPCNTTFSAVDFLTKKEVKWGVIMTQPYGNRVAMENFANSGETISLGLSPDGSVEMPSQYVGTNTLGKVFTYSIDAGKTNPTALPQAVTGKVDGNVVSLGAWGAFPFNSPAKPMGRYTETKLTTTLSITMPGDITPSFQGDGSRQNPYRIASYDDLMALASLVNAGNDQKDVYFTQTADIDCAKVKNAFNPIGYAKSNLDYYQFDPSLVPFNGIYDGGGHKISNLECMTGMRWYLGLFGVIGQQGKVSNLTMENGHMESYGRMIGILCGLNLGVVDNCHVTGGELWNSMNTVGGLCGMNFGTISNSSASASVTSQGNMGGLAGYNAGHIRMCRASGTLNLDDVFSTSLPYAGGVVGVMSAESKKITAEGGPQLTDCCFYGDINDRMGAPTTTTGGVAGGIVGTRTAELTLERCFSMATINTVANGSNGAFGGIAGNLAYGNIKNCLFAGMIKSTMAPTVVGGILAKTGAGMKAGCVSGCYSSARIVTIDPNPNPVLAVFPKLGTGSFDSYFTDVYYDTDASGLNISGFAGAKSTSELSSGTLPAGFDASVWTAGANLYPMLRSMEAFPAAKVAATPVFFATGENVRKVKTPFTLSAASGACWGLRRADGSLVQQSEALALSGLTATPKNTYATQQLQIYSGDKECCKIYEIDIVPSSLFEGKGTEAEPYLIKTLADLKKMAEATVAHGSNFEGDYFRMTNDIDCAYDPSFHGIASSGSPLHVFGGNFDGDGFTIRRLNIYGVVTDVTGAIDVSRSPSYVGFFGRISSTGVVRNLTIGADARLTYTATSGALAGYVDGTIENCVNLADVKGINGNIAGIAGSLSKTGVIRDSYNAGHISCGSTIAGGIAGNCAGTITGCQNDGRISGTVTSTLRGPGYQKNIGGIAGQTVSSAIIEDCLNTGVVESYGGSGGIVGYLNGSTLTNCVSTGASVCFAGYRPIGAVYGNTATAKARLSGIYYDSNVNSCGASSGVNPAGVTPLSTVELVSGKMPQGLDPGKWLFAAGQYPVLGKFKALAPARAFSSMVVLFGAGQQRDDVKGTVALAKADGLVWSLTGKEPSYSIAGGSLVATVPTGSTAVTDTLTSTVGDWRRAVPLRTLPKAFNGEGTEQNPYLISSVSDLARLSYLTNEYSAPYNGIYFRVTGDIDCSALTSFVPIGYSDNSFGGVIDGDGHSLRNFSISGNTEATALVGTLSSGGAIRNLTIEGGSITTDGAMRPVAAFAAFCSGSVENCVNRDSVSTLVKGTNAAGIVYQLNAGGEVINCRNYGAIISKSNYLGGIVALQQSGSTVESCGNFAVLTPGGSQSGAIVGTSYGRITRCVNHASQTVGKGTFGGIVGYACDTTTLEFCINKGDIILENGASQGGGIAGYAYGRVHMDSCVNHGDISVAGGYAGGLTGRMGAALSTVTRCVNYGGIKSGKQYAGGLAGYVDGSSAKASSFAMLTNHGPVEATGNYIGGAFGYIKAYNKVSRSATYGNVKGLKGNYVAGFAGYGYADFTDCLNAGSVDADGYGTSGFVGDASGSVITRCVNTGSVTSTALKATATNFGAAGFWAKGKGKAIDCCNLGSVTAPDFLSGFIGAWSSGSEATRCWAAAGVKATAADAALCTPFIASAPASSVFSGNYYDSTLASGLANSVSDAASPAASPVMLALDMGESWLNMRATYPMLKVFADDGAVALASIGILFGDGSDKADAITTNFYMGYPLQSLIWDTSGQFRLSRSDKGLVYPDRLGEGWIRISTPDGRFSRTWNLNVTRTTGAGIVNGGIKSVECYTLGGIRVTDPADGGIYVVRTIWDNGTVTVEKRIWNAAR